MRKNYWLTDLIHAAALTLGLCVISPQAAAAVVCVGNGSIATSCSGVVFDNTVYEITWALGNYPTGPIPPFGPFNPDIAGLNMIADINSALNTGGFNSIKYGTSPTDTATYFYLPWRIFGIDVGSIEGVYNDSSPDVSSTGHPNTWYTDPNPDLTSGTSTSNPYAFYYNATTQNTLPTVYLTPTGTVPVPAALPLFLSGIAFVGWIDRRRRQAS